MNFILNKYYQSKKGYIFYILYYVNKCVVVLFFLLFNNLYVFILILYADL